MKYVKLFEEYTLAESTLLPVLRSVDDFTQEILSQKNKEKVIKSVVKDWGHAQLKYKDFYIPRYTITYKYQGTSYVAMFGAKTNDGRIDLSMSDVKEFSIFIFSENKVSKAMIDSVFDYEVSGTTKNTEYFLKRKSIKSITDFALDKGAKGVLPDNPNVTEIVYNVKSVPVTQFDVTNTSEFKKFTEETGLEMISTSRQLKNGTIVLAFPVLYAYSDEPDNRKWLTQIQDREAKPQKYMLNALQLSSAGYIRKVGGFNPGYEIRSAVVGKFTVTPQGWISAIQKCREIWTKWKKDWEKDGIHLIDTEEERHQKRGKLMGKKFGF